MRLWVYIHNDSKRSTVKTYFNILMFRYQYAGTCNTGCEPMEFGREEQLAFLARREKALEDRLAWVRAMKTALAAQTEVAKEEKRV